MKRNPAITYRPSPELRDRLREYAERNRWPLTVAITAALEAALEADAVDRHKNTYPECVHDQRCHPTPNGDRDARED